MEGTIQNNDFVVYLTSTSRSCASVVLFRFGLSWLVCLLGWYFWCLKEVCSRYTLFGSPNLGFRGLRETNAHTFSLWFMIESFGFDLLMSWVTFGLWQESCMFRLQPHRSEIPLSFFCFNFFEPHFIYYWKFVTRRISKEFSHTIDEVRAMPHPMDVNAIFCMVGWGESEQDLCGCKYEWNYTFYLKCSSIYLLFSTSGLKDAKSCSNFHPKGPCITWKSGPLVQENANYA